MFAYLALMRVKCWEKARKKPGNHVIDVADMARDGGASEDIVQYIHEMVEWDEAFGSLKRHFSIFNIDTIAYQKKYG